MKPSQLESYLLELIDITEDFSTITIEELGKYDETRLTPKICSNC